MATPKLEVFFLFDNNGDPKTGVTGLTFSTYKDHLGVNITPQPTISEIGGGAYKFLPVFVSDQGIVYVVNATGSNPKYVTKFMRPEDYAAEEAGAGQIDAIDAALGKWQIFTSGPDANRLVIYRQDTTVLKKFDLFDKDGLPTAVNPFRREPVP